MLVAPLLALALAAQFTEGSFVSSQGCQSLITGTQTTIVSADVGTFQNAAAHQPKQGDVFTVFINVLAFPQPCGTRLHVRPGFRLPASLALATDAAAPRCFMGPAGGALAAQQCPLEPTDTLPDGTLIFDAPNGLWSIPDGQQLQIQIPVTGHSVGSAPLFGYVDFVAFDGFHAPLSPSVSTQVFFNPPLVSAAAPAVDELGSSSAHVHGIVNTHQNAGVVRLEVGPAGESLVVVAEGELAGDADVFDVDSRVEGLAPDTTYSFRWTYQVSGSSQVVAGPTQPFRTLAAPRYGSSSTVTGAGSIDASVEPFLNLTYADGTVVTFTAIPEAGSHLASFTVNGSPVAGPSTTVTITGPLDVRAAFEPGVDEDGDDADEAASDEAANPNADVGDDATLEDGAPRSTGIRAQRDGDSDDGDAGGCAAAAPGGAPVLFVAVAFRRARRRAERR